MTAMEDTAPPGHRALLAAVRAYVNATPEVAAFVGGTLDASLPFRALDPATLPCVAQVPAMRTQSGAETQAITDAIVAAVPELQWRQSYDTTEVGDHFLANSGWFNLVSPDGPFVSDRIRVSAGYWGKGLDYPDHRHMPEEIYLTLAGSAVYRSATQAPLSLGPGGRWHNESNVMHGAKMEHAPLLALAFWRGERLTAKSDFHEAAA